MKTDRELLELAAKASGELTASWYGNDAYFDGVLSRWNPLNDDGDALRLAVKLRLVIDTDYNDGAAVGSAFLDMDCCYEPDNPMRFGADRSAATRRAITLAAAAIGEGMK